MYVGVKWWGMYLSVCFVLIGGVCVLIEGFYIGTIFGECCCSVCGGCGVYTCVCVCVCVCVLTLVCVCANC